MQLWAMEMHRTTQDLDHTRSQIDYLQQVKEADQQVTVTCTFALIFTKAEGVLGPLVIVDENVLALELRLIGIGNIIHQQRARGSSVTSQGSVVKPSKNHLEERLLDQAQARASYTPPFLWSFT